MRGVRHVSTPYDDLGFVTLDEIQNVFVEGLRNLEEKILPNVPAIEARMDRAYITTAVDEMRLKLMQRARHNVQDYLTRHPVVRNEDRERREKESADKNKTNWENRVKLGRQFAREQ